jgi:hypothetical protein
MLCSENEDIEEMVVSHLQTLEAMPQCKGAYKHIIIEANMSYISADLVATWCRRKQFTNMIIDSKDSTDRGRVGVWTGAYEKEAYSYMLRDQIKEMNLFFSSYLFGKEIEKAKREFMSQLRTFRLERQDPSDPSFGKYKYSFTGKTKGGNKDDMVLAVMMAIYWGTRKRENPQFITWAKQYGIRL